MSDEITAAAARALPCSYADMPERVYRPENCACANCNQRPAVEAEMRKLVEPLEGVLSMAVARLGGIVEGLPTSRVNFLQRIDELRKIESEVQQMIKDARA